MCCSIFKKCKVGNRHVGLFRKVTFILTIYHLFGVVYSYMLMSFNWSCMSLSNLMDCFKGISRRSERIRT